MPPLHRSHSCVEPCTSVKTSATVPVGASTDGERRREVPPTPGPSVVLSVGNMCRTLPITRSPSPANHDDREAGISRPPHLPFVHHYTEHANNHHRPMPDGTTPGCLPFHVVNVRRQRS